MQKKPKQLMARSPKNEGFIKTFRSYNVFLELP
jgi:hypothetical protein